ncbi:MAG: MFS transporter, partial [Halothece sp. Uz-M2-17]|nr:MFS transporter [Halothece sp. Uz-M2-17]
MTAPSPQKPRISPLIFIILTVFIEVMGGSLLFPLIPYLVEEYRSDALTIGLLSSSFAIAQFICSPVLGSFSDRVGRRPVLLVCTLGTAISFFVFASAQALWVMFLAQIINGITGGVVSTAQAYIADVSGSPEERTKNFGLIGAAAGIGFIFGPILGGTLAGIALRLPIYLAGFIALTNVVMGYLTVQESLRERVETPLTWQSFSPIAQLRDLFQRDNLRYLLASYVLFYLGFAGFTSVFVVFVRDRFLWTPS